MGHGLRTVQLRFGKRPYVWVQDGIQFPQGFEHVLRDTQVPVEAVFRRILPETKVALISDRPLPNGIHRQDVVPVTEHLATESVIGFR